MRCAVIGLVIQVEQRTGILAAHEIHVAPIAPIAPIATVDPIAPIAIVKHNHSDAHDYSSTQSRLPLRAWV